MEEIDYHIAFSHFLGVGPVRFDALLSYFGSARSAYNAKEEELKNILKGKIASDFIAFRRRFNIADKLKEIENKKITVLTRSSKFFPSLLKNISDTPICLYVRGKIENFDWENDYSVAIVGTRRPSDYGRHITRMFATDLAKSGLTIVSGMALGVDGEAHTACLDSGGKTVAVLGCGVDIPYPSSHTVLYRRIIESGSIVMSEFPPGMFVQRGYFVSRNRLVAGLSRGVLVVEGLKDSGSLITARLAGEQGREVFAPPVPVTSQLSEAPNMLIKQGATFVANAKDVLESLNLHLAPAEEKKIVSNLSGMEEKVFRILAMEEMFVDDISKKLVLTMSETLSLVTSLELKGLIGKNSSGRFFVT